jgi:hypothetical protein
LRRAFNRETVWRVVLELGGGRCSPRISCCGNRAGRKKGQVFLRGIIRLSKSTEADGLPPTLCLVKFGALETSKALLSGIAERFDFILEETPPAAPAAPDLMNASKMLVHLFDAS